MNKLITICICLILCCSIFVSCTTDNTGRPVKEFIGMSYDEFCEKIPENHRSQYYQFLFFSDSNGNPYAACLGQTEGTYTTVVECYSYSKNKFDTSVASFEQIVPGMTIFEVVEKVGIPMDAGTFGLATLVFQGDDGEYVIVLDAKTNNETVAEINRR